MREVPLTQGKVAVVDASDWPVVAPHRWRAALIRGHWYACATVDGNNNTYLHRFLTGCPRGTEVDHINGDGLDCRRINMRFATRSQNAQNLQGAHRDSLTGVRGVTFDKWAGRYRAVVIVNRQPIRLGYFRSLAAAERAAIEGRRRFMTHSSECERPAELVAQLALPGMGIPT